MTPGEMRRMIGRELFNEPHMGLSAYMGQCKPGDIALIIALDKFVTEDDAGQDITVDVALVLIGWQLGWTPTNWLEVL